MLRPLNIELFGHALRILSIIWALLVSALPLMAQESGPVRVLPNASTLESDNYVITLSLALSRAVAYRVVTMDNPRRLLIDLPETDFSFMQRDLDDSVNAVSAVRYGHYKPDQSRIVIDLVEPFTISSVEFMENTLTVILERNTEQEFTLQSITPKPNSDIFQAAPNISGETGLPLIAIDAGHGGVDPGAVRGDITEKQVTLAFALKLRDALLETGRYRVLMTRVDDSYLELPERIRLARASHADVFLSLHANTVEKGNPRGTSVYSLSEEASDDEAANRASFENRSDIVAGTVLQGEDDQIANILIELAQRKTNAGSVQFADILADTIRYASDENVPSRRLAANFRVLRAVDTPSALIELGFMSNTSDLANLMADEWRNAAAQAVIAALDEWFILRD